MPYSAKSNSTGRCSCSSTSARLQPAGAVAAAAALAPRLCDLLQPLRHRLCASHQRLRVLRRRGTFHSSVALLDQRLPWDVISHFLKLYRRLEPYASWQSVEQQMQSPYCNRLLCICRPKQSKMASFAPPKMASNLGRKGHPQDQTHLDGPLCCACSACCACACLAWHPVGHGYTAAGWPWWLKKTAPANWRATAPPSEAHRWDSESFEAQRTCENCSRCLMSIHVNSCQIMSVDVNSCQLMSIHVSWCQLIVKKGPISEWRSLAAPSSDVIQGWFGCAAWSGSQGGTGQKNSDSKSVPTSFQIYILICIYIYINVLIYTL